MRAHRSARLEPVLGRYSGRLVKLTGDGARIELQQAVNDVDPERPVGPARRWPAPRGFAGLTV